jgi:thiol-disulfide isomerase/thioredoxin
MGLRFLTLCVATALALACAPLSFGQGGFDAPVDERRYTPPEAGWWRGALRIDDRLSVGFYFELPPIAFEGVHPATIANGREKIEVAAAWEEGTLTLDFPHYDASIRSHRALVGSEIGLFGEYRKTVSEGEQRVMTFEAVPIGPARPSPAFRNSSALPVGTPRADFEGEWKIDFEKSGPAKAIFRQPGGGDAITGTVLTTTGDYRFLSGGVGDRTLAVSVFDGAHAFLITATADASTDRIEGTFYSGAHYRESFTGERVAEGETYELPDAFEQVGLTSPDGRLRVDALDDPMYEGQPVVVTFFGTWCPNCHDEAPVLVDLYRRYSPRGLRMLGLAYEHTGDDERSRRQVERFKQKYGIPWEIIVAGPSSKAYASESVPSLSAIKSWPTTVFIGRDGKVKGIHSGFAGPATGEAHRELLREFERRVQEIVKAPPTTP